MDKIYLIKSLNEGVYKIGVSKDPNKRISQLQTGNSSPLEIMVLYESNNAYKIEKALHRRFYHLNEKGEWFNLSQNEAHSFLDLCTIIDNTILFLKKSDNPFI